MLSKLMPYNTIIQPTKKPKVIHMYVLYVEQVLVNFFVSIYLNDVKRWTNVLRDKDDNIIFGDPDRVTETIDIWTFSRDTRSRDPSWVLCATRDEDAADKEDKTVPDSWGKWYALIFSFERNRSHATP